jgi:hypothetical protein
VLCLATVVVPADTLGWLNCFPRNLLEAFQLWREADFRSQGRNDWKILIKPGQKVVIQVNTFLFTQPDLEANLTRCTWGQVVEQDTPSSVHVMGERLDATVTADYSHWQGWDEGGSRLEKTPWECMAWVRVQIMKKHPVSRITTIFNEKCTLTASQRPLWGKMHQKIWEMGMEPPVKLSGAVAFDARWGSSKLARSPLLPERNQIPSVG